MDSRFLTIKEGMPSMATPFSMSVVAGEAIPANYVVHINSDTGIARKAHGDLRDPALVGFLYGFTQAAVAENDVFDAQLVGYFKPHGLTVGGLFPIPIRLAYLTTEIANAGLITDIPPTTGPAILQELGKLFVKDSEVWCYFNPALRVLLDNGA